MKKVEASAKTREEAIQNALKELGVEMYEVDKIEIIDEGSKGLFGFGARPVRVQLVVENMPDEPLREDSQNDQSRGSNRGRGNRNQNRDAKPRGERSEQNINREGRGRGRDDKPRNERNNRNDQSRGERNNQGDKPRNERNNRNDKPRNERGGRNDKSRNERDNRQRNSGADEAQETQDSSSENETRNQRGRNRSENDTGRSEIPRSRGARDRNRNDRDRKPEGDQSPRAEASESKPNGRNKRAEGVTEDIIEPITDEQGQEAATLLEEIITKMGIEAKAEFSRSEDGSARLNVSSEDSAILIGRKGRNLSSMQYLINRIISRGDTNENTERLIVDVEGYVNRRRESLQEMAKSMAARAKETKRNMRLKPLSPQERRIIHLTLEGDEDIRTFSLGESLYRSVVISPKGATNPERGRSSRGGRGGRRRGGRDRSQGQRGGQNRESQKDQDVDVGTFGD